MAAPSPVVGRVPCMTATLADSSAANAGYFQDPDGHLWEAVWNPQRLPEQG